MNQIKKHFLEVCESLSLADETEIERIVEILRDAGKRGAYVWLMGNGGSSATAAHFANDLVKMCHVKAIDISGMTPVTLAYGNDYGWERMFANTVKELASPLDVLVVISCSGNSANILEAVEAVSFKCAVVALTGETGGKLDKLPTSAIVRAMANEITVQEDVHSIICHAIARSIRCGDKV